LVLLGQCFYYRGFTLGDRTVDEDASRVVEDEESGPTTERSTLLGNGGPPLQRRRRSSTAFITSVDGTHLSPATPLLDPPARRSQPNPTTLLQALAFNIVAVLLVCFAGVLGWWISARNSIAQRQHKGKTGGGGLDADHDVLTFNVLGQVFGYLCAILYLGSRIPQILLNHRRKSTEGVAMLFFIFACIGNLTYVLSIFAYSPRCTSPGRHCEPGEAPRLYARYILVNTSWLLGSFGTLLLDLGIFAQFFWYRDATMTMTMTTTPSESSSAAGDEDVLR
jgi:hypothetical protein